MLTFLHRSHFAGFVVVLFLPLPQTAVAQAVAVQQPVVRTMGVSTTVSVPDRGTTYLGGMNSAASGRISPGPFRPGTNSGLERSGSSMSVSVFVHDLQAMDEALLNQGPTTPSESDMWSARLNQRRAQSNAGVNSAVVEDTASQAARYEQLAREAESRRKFSIARMHWQVAAKLGSPVARQRLTALQP